MNKKLIVTFTIITAITMIAGIAYFFSDKDNSVYCDIQLKGLKGCHGQTIKISGINPISNGIIEQHPIMTIPPEISGDGAEQYQSYLDTKYGQFVLLSKEEISCFDKMTIIGELDSEIPPCDPSLAKNCGSISITVEQYKCD